ncbi:MAG: hypothetical protein GX814_07550 [Microbacteriaceae bacterium]|nr:hypothetical protein [Microbacteriaceae bacterium]
MTTTLRQWSATQSGALWISPGRVLAFPAFDQRQAADGPIEQTSEAVIVIDDADDLTPEEWDRIDEIRRLRPLTRIRLAVHSRFAVPFVDDVEFVHDLLFSFDETSQFLASRNSALDARAVHLVSGGLPAAVKAIAGLKTLRPALVEQVLAHQAHAALPQSQSVLAMPEMLTDRVVESLGEQPHVLEWAERQGFGWWVADSNYPLFLLTATVRAATRLAHPKPTESELRELAAEAFIQQGAWLGAIAEGFALHSLPIIDAALKGGGMPLLVDHGPFLLHHLSRIRVHELRRWPVIALAHALLLNAQHEHRLRAAEMLGVAMIGLRSKASTPLECALSAVIESVLQRLLGIGDGGVQAGLRGVALTNELSSEDQLQGEGLIGDLYLHCAISLLYGGKTEPAIHAFEMARSVSQRPGIILNSYGGVAAVHALAGDLEAAAPWIDSASARAWPSTVFAGYNSCLLHIARAKVFIEQNELDQAEAALDTVWHMIETTEHWPLLASLRATLDLCRGRFTEALESFRGLRKRRGSRMPRSQVRLLDLTESSLTLAAGDPARASSLRPQQGDHASILVGVARAQMYQGQFDDALHTLSAVPQDEPEVRLSSAVLEAVVLYRRGDDEAAQPVVRRARGISEAYGLTTAFLLLTAEDRALFDVEIPWLALQVDTSGVVVKLTERERVVLRSLTDGSSVEEIARRLHVSPNTVKSQRRSLYRKLGVRSRDEAITRAVSQGLLRDDAHR